MILKTEDIPVSTRVNHTPSLLSPTPSLQYTINAKKVEVAVKKIISGEDVTERGALANPSSLDLYYNLPQLSLNDPQ